MATLADLSDSDLLALKAGDLSKLSDDGLASLKAMRSAPAPKASGPVEGVMPDDAAFRPYKPGLADLISNSAVVRGLSKILGPTEQQRLEQASDAYGREQRGLAPREQTLDEKGLIPAIMKSAATPVRVAGGVLSSEGGPTGSAKNAIAEGVAQLMEGRVDPGRVGQAAVLAAPPLGAGVSTMRAGGQMALAGGAGEAIRQALNGEAIDPTAIGTNAAMSGGVTAAMRGLSGAIAPRVPQAGEMDRIAREQLDNVNKDRVLAAMQAKGAAVIPSSVNPSTKNKIFESVAGIQNVEAGVARRNAPIFADAARREASLAATDPINETTLDAARSRIAATSYAPVRAAGQGQLLDDWRTANTLVKKAQTALDSGFTNARGAAVDDAAANLANAEKALMDAGWGKELNDARTAFAKNYDVEQAVASGTDEVNPAVLSNLLRQRGEQGLTGELRDIAQFNNAFGRSAKNPTKLATAPGAASAGTALIVGGGNPVTTTAMIGGVPIVRGMIRDRLVSPKYQQANAIRQYIPRAEADPVVTAILQRLGANATADTQLPPAVQAILNRLSAPSP